MGRVRRPGEIVWPLSFPSSLAQSFCVQWLHETLKRLPWAKGMLWAEVRAWCVLQLSNVAVVVSLVVWVERSLESSCWEMERRFVWKLHVVGSDGAWRWWCLLQWCRWWIDGSSEDERWPDLEVTMSLCYTNCDAHESSLYVGKGVCVFFYFWSSLHHLFCFLCQDCLNWLWAEITNSTFSILCVLWNTFLHGCDAWGGLRTIPGCRQLFINTTYQTFVKQSYL